MAGVFAEDDDLKDIEFEVEDAKPEIAPPAPQGEEGEEGSEQPETDQQPQAPAEQPEGDDDEGEPEPPKAGEPKRKKTSAQRISELTWQRHEAERQRQAAIEYAQRLQQELEQARNGAYTTARAGYEAEMRAVDAEMAAAKRAATHAFESGNNADYIEQQAKIAELAASKERIRAFAANYAAPQQPSSQSQQQPRQQSGFQPPPPAPSPKAREWVAKNPWFFQDREANEYARLLSRQLTQRGISDMDDEHYEAVDREMKARFPQYYPAQAKQAAPQARTSPVAPVGSRAPTGQRIRVDSDPGFKSAVRIAQQMNPHLDVKDPGVLKSLWADYQQASKS